MDRLASSALEAPDASEESRYPMSSSPGSRADVDDIPEALPADLIPIQYHFNMLNDTARMDGFHRAIEMAVCPGMSVLDLGGGTGVLSHFAAMRGAERVWCVERLAPLVRAARAALAESPAGDRVTVVNADADTFLPPERVDVVLCEMLHTGLLRERQIQIIGGFKERYLARFGLPLPAFVPAATIQAVQPIQQDFEYFGYTARTPLFQDARSIQSRTTELGPPQVFQSFAYDEALPERCEVDGPLAITASGTCNAVRIITKNVLAMSLRTGETAEWLMGYLVIPLPAPIPVRAGDAPVVSFSYRPGDELDALTGTISLTRPRIIDVATTNPNLGRFVRNPHESDQVSGSGGGRLGGGGRLSRD